MSKIPGFYAITGGALIMTSQAKAAAMPCRKLPKMPPTDKLKVKKSVAVILKYEKIRHERKRKLHT